MIDPPPLGEFWFLDFAAPYETILTPGVYANAMRFPFQDPGRPGLDVSGNGRGSNTLTGQFTVYDVAFAGSALTRFAAAFEQHSEGNPPALFGWIMFNSTFGAGGGVLANDTDVENDLLLGATLVAGPANGTLAWRGDGTFSYIPNPNFHGTDSFTYRTNDGRADSNVATVTITVNAVNDPPVADDDDASTDEDTGVTIAVLSNDTDVDGDILAVSSITQPSHGTATINADGTITYTPAANYNGPDSFTYSASDGNGGTDAATVSLTVRPVNDAPVAVDDTATTDEDSAATIAVLANDSDVDGDALSPILASGPSHGSVVLNADGTFTYTPNTNYNGADSFTYRASDGTLSSNVATVMIDIRPVNDAPSAANDNYATDQGQVLDVPAAGVLANDTDVDGDALTAVLVGGPTNGTLTLFANGSFRYTPNAGFTGTDTFTYRASDGALESNLATVSILVSPAATTEGSVSGGGYTDRGLRRLSANVKSKIHKKGFDLSGKIVFRDKENRIVLRSTAIQSFHVDSTGTRAVVKGTAKVNGRAGYTFTVTVDDLGEPGRGRDKFRVQITGPAGFEYDSFDYSMRLGLIDGGNFQVRRRA
jgi:VCBS repeat-containing protein